MVIVPPNLLYLGLRDDCLIALPLLRIVLFEFRRLSTLPDLSDIVCPKFLLLFMKLLSTLVFLIFVILDRRVFNSEDGILGALFDHLFFLLVTGC